MLHIGDNKTVSRRDIVIIMPVKAEEGTKSTLLLADGKVVYSNIAATTLQKRLEEIASYKQQAF